MLNTKKNRLFYVSRQRNGAINIILSISLLFVACIAFFVIYNKMHKMAAAKAERISTAEVLRLGSWPYYSDGDRRDIEWIVLEKKRDGTAVLLAKDAIDSMAYNSIPEGTNDAGRVAVWETSTIRKWLNTEFFNKAFSDKEQKSIKSILVYNNNSIGKFTKEFIEYWKKWDIDFSSFDGETWETPAGNDTVDKIWLLSIDELQKYSNVLNMNMRKAYPTPYAAARTEVCKSELCKKNHAYGFCGWYLRSPGYNKDDVAYVYSDGQLYAFGLVADNPSAAAVRPAMAVNLNELFAD